jgi:hypothetical protein
MAAIARRERASADMRGERASADMVWTAPPT